MNELPDVGITSLVIGVSSVVQLGLAPSEVEPPSLEIRSLDQEVSSGLAVARLKTNANMTPVALNRILSMLNTRMSECKQGTDEYGHLQAAIGFK